MPFVKVGQFLYVSGQISQDENGLITGKLGENMNVEQGAMLQNNVHYHYLHRLKLHAKEILLDWYEL